MARHSAQELHEKAAETTAKYIYFLLATSGASIAYSVEVANSSKFSWSLLLLAVALLSWVTSFYAGCKSLQYDISVKNFSFDLQQSTEHLDMAKEILNQQAIYELEKLYQEAVESTNSALNSHGSEASRYLKLQFRALILGVVAFVVWRATEFLIHALAP